MDALKRYDQIFSRFLFDRRFRDRVRAGDWSEVGADADVFSGVDLEASERLAIAIRDGLIGGSLGGLGLGKAFGQTIEALGGGVSEVVERFLAAHPEAPAFDGTCRKAGVSVFESFYVWADTQLAERPVERRQAQHELAAALIRTLGLRPNPGFLVRWPLARPVPCGWYCVLDAERPLEGPRDPPEHPAAYVGAIGQYVTGEDALDFAAVALADAGDPPPWVGERLVKLDPADLAELRDVLATGGPG